jgi:hypothetical protein
MSDGLTSNNCGSLELLAKGRVGYIVKNEFLVSLMEEGAPISRQEAHRKLVEKIKSIIEELREFFVDEDDLPSLKFTIGKTGVVARKGMQVDPLNSNTWVYAATDKASIGKRWVDTYRPAGYRAIIPIACVHASAIPAHIGYPKPHAHRYALDLEEDTIAICQTPDLVGGQPWTDLLEQNKEYNRGKPGTTANALLYVAIKW